MLGRLAQAAAGVGVELSEEGWLRVSRFWVELRRWGARMNLTSSLEEDALLLHTVDSLGVLPHIAPDAWVVDVGSGGGFPGLVLACGRPEQRFTLVESVAKKAAFLSHSARAIGLNQVGVENRRAEGLAGGYDLAVSRAAMEPSVWLSLGRGLVRPGGRVVAMVSGESPAGFAGERIDYRLPGGLRHALLIVDV